MTIAFTPIAFTPGEPAGVGLDLAIINAQKFNPSVDLLTFSDPDILQTRAKKLGLSIRILENQKASQAGDINVVPIRCPYPVIVGKPNYRNSHFVLNALDNAIKYCTTQKNMALLTGPIHKATINEAGINFSGHSEYLAAKTKSQVVMMLANKKLKVALATTHLPLKVVPQYINKNRIKQTLYILHKALITQFNIAQPKIAICGLNPHAGEQGYLGREEIEVINPAISELRKDGIYLSNALPADTLFTPDNLKKYDAFLAMYHDQGLAVVKALDFENSTNITLGLPFVRVSVGHGTALALAGTTRVSLGSLQAALTYAKRLINCTND